MYIYIYIYLYLFSNYLLVYIHINVHNNAGSLEVVNVLQVDLAEWSPLPAIQHQAEHVRGFQGRLKPLGRASGHDRLQS